MFNFLEKCQYISFTSRAWERAVPVFHKSRQKNSSNSEKIKLSERKTKFLCL